MITISMMSKNANMILGQQRYHTGINYVPMPYTRELQVDAGTLMFNVLTREIILLEDGEDATDLQEQLVEHWFMIPGQVDPASMLYMFQAANRSMFDGIPGLEQATILPTTDCNARCGYCYEAGCSRRDMNQATAVDVADFIMQHAGRNKLILKWFGGEPLLNPSAIDTICRELKRNHIAYESTMVTNGYYLDLCDASRLQDLWKIKRVQITLDGTRETYNAVKNYTDAGDAYGRVFGNIGYLLALGIRVNVRLNLSLDNYKDLMALVDELKRCYGQYQNLAVYSHQLFDSDSFRPDEKERRTLYGNYRKLQDYIRSAGIGAKQGLPRIRVSRCMADNGKSVVILPGGELGLCEHHLDDEYIGSIYDSDMNQEAIRSWREPDPEKPECAGCFWRPACVRLRKCPGQDPCTEEYREHLGHRADSVMLRTYQNYLRRKADAKL